MPTAHKRQNTTIQTDQIYDNQTNKQKDGQTERQEGRNLTQYKIFRM